MLLRFLTTAAILVSAAVAPAFGAGGDLAVSRINLYLIWEGSGKLSDNMASEPHITTVSRENGSASQMLVDVVVEGTPGGLYEDVPSLKIEVLRPYGTDDSLMQAKSIPITYVHDTGKLYTTVVVEHGCEPFNVVAWIERGGQTGAQTTKEVMLDCGD
jgi:hypothetical protein